jgi:DNA (cytosine-5)-methyltransferase 1
MATRNGRSKPLTVVEMFAGAGGAAVGLHRAHFRSIAAIDMWPPAVETLRAVGLPAIEGRVEDPRVLHEVMGRVRQARGIDLLWASPPCQPYSSSGLRLGEIDERDGWGATLLYVVKLEPKIVIVENVKDAPVEEWAEAIGKLGHFAHAGSFKLQSTDFGEAQVRPRAFVYAGTWALDRFLTEIARHKKKAKSISEQLPHLRGTYPFVRSEQTTARARSIDEPCPTIVTKGTIYFHKKDVGVRRVGYRKDDLISRRATPEELAVLQGFPKDYPFVGNAQEKYKLIGNAVSPSVAQAIGLAAAAVLMSP